MPNGERHSEQPVFATSARHDWAVIILLWLTFCAGTSPVYAQSSTNAAFPHEAYVWQRSWNASVRQAVTEHGAAFSNLVVLAAEVSWKQSQPEVTRVTLDYPTLRSTGKPVGLALRIGGFSGPFSENDRIADALTKLAVSLVTEAKAHDLAPAELQLDFDCASSKLEGYRVWLGAFRRKVAPLPVTITTLPSWLKEPAFGPLVKASDGFVLQVHSLDPPKSFDAPFTLCDPAAARAAVAKAATFGVPFRVALPTYGYLLAFTSEGRFVGLSAEGPSRSWPENVKLREVRADAPALAELVHEWSAKPPASLRGVIWYRFPVADDTFNWRWPTLGAILAGRSPRESVRAEPGRVEAGLVEINLVNDGELDFSSRLAVEIRWQDARLVAGDGLRGFELVEVDASTARFQTQSTPQRLPAGARQVIGWLRLNKNVEVQVELKKQ